MVVRKLIRNSSTLCKYIGIPLLIAGMSFSVQAEASTDHDGDGLIDSIDTDDDNDGMLDSWELFYALDSLNSADAAHDADGDGRSNLEEHVAQTNPLVADTLPAFPVAYEVTTIAAYAFAADINDAGDVVGRSCSQCGQAGQSWLYTDVTGLQQYTPSAYYRLLSYGINNSQEIVGTTGSNNWAYSSFQWTAAGSFIYPPTSSRAIARANSNTSYVVGELLDQDQAFLWRNGEPVQMLGTLGGAVSCMVHPFWGAPFDRCANSVGMDVNDSGNVVGYSYLPNSVRRAFAYTSGNGMVDMGTLRADNLGVSEAAGINELNQAVGYAAAATGYSGAFVYDLTGTGMVALPGLGSTAAAHAINDSNVIVGTAHKDVVGSVAVVWKNGVIRDLNELIPSDSGWVLRSAVGINAQGQIIGDGTHNGIYAVFRLEPYSVDSDGDGILDDVDACPNEDSTGFDANQDGCIDTINGLIELLRTLVQEGVISPELETALIIKVDRAEKSSDKENICAAVSQLNAFKNHVVAQQGDKITAEASTMLIEYADTLITGLEALTAPPPSC